MKLSTGQMTSRVWMTLVFVFLYLPIAVLVIYSFNSSRLNIVWDEFTLDWYAKLWANGPLIRAAKNSLHHRRQAGRHGQWSVVQQAGRH